MLNVRLERLPKTASLLVFNKDLHFSLEAGRYYEVEIKRNSETHTLYLVFVRFLGFWMNPDPCNNVLSFRDGEGVEVDIKRTVYMPGEIEVN